MSSIQQSPFENRSDPLSKHGEKLEVSKNVISPVSSQDKLEENTTSLEQQPLSTTPQNPVLLKPTQQPQVDDSSDSFHMMLEKYLKVLDEMISKLMNQIPEEIKTANAETKAIINGLLGLLKQGPIPEKLFFEMLEQIKEIEDKTKNDLLALRKLIKEEQKVRDELHGIFLTEQPQKDEKDDLDDKHRKSNIVNFQRYNDTKI